MGDFFLVKLDVDSWISSSIQQNEMEASLEAFKRLIPVMRCVCRYMHIHVHIIAIGIQVRRRYGIAVCKL
jgi:hypothetical protein